MIIPSIKERNLIFILVTLFTLPTSSNVTDTIASIQGNTQGIQRIKFDLIVPEYYSNVIFS